MSLVTHAPRKRGDTRTRMLISAAEVMRERGAAGVTIDEVQARTGIRAQTLTKELRKIPNAVSELVMTGSTFLHGDVLVDFRRRSMELHPDHGGDAGVFRMLVAERKRALEMAVRN